MKRLELDERREKRIDTEILADAFDEQERAMGWYYYLANTLVFPFTAKCAHSWHKSPLTENDQVEIIGMAPENKCLREIFVEADWNGKTIAAPLAQLRGVDVDDAAQQALDDWHYWVGRGYGF